MFRTIVRRGSVCQCVNLCIGRNFPHTFVCHGYRVIKAQISPVGGYLLQSFFCFGVIALFFINRVICVVDVVTDGSDVAVQRQVLIILQQFIAGCDHLCLIVGCLCVVERRQIGPISFRVGSQSGAAHQKGEGESQSPNDFPLFFHSIYPFLIFPCRLHTAVVNHFCSFYIDKTNKS